MRAILIIISIVFGLQQLQAQTYAKSGMVVSDNKLASDIGVHILKQGGNSVDAAIATAFALAVTHPQAGNIGGGGFLVFMNSKGFATTIDFREKAPLAATSNMFLDQNGQLIAGSNHNGIKSIGVPGTVAGLYLAHQKYGKLPWRQLVKPAVQLAERGFKLSFTLAQHAQKFNTGSYPDFLRHYFTTPNGELLGFNQTFKQPALAKTLRCIMRDGRDGFYKGEVAKEIADFMTQQGGLITLQDLEQYTAIERQPIRGSYKDYEIYAMPPPSSGGVALVEMMNILEHANLDTIPFNSTNYVHLISETMRRAFADRAEFLGDPDFNPDLPTDKLMSKAFAKARYESINFKAASKSDATKYGQLYEGDHTTHLSVIDKEGDAVSLTYTIEQSYGSGIGSPKLGFIFNNEMGDFNPQPGLTNAYGLIGSNPNTIAPEKRMLSSMSPTIIAKDGKPYFVIGSPGGRTIINTVFQTVLNVLEYKMSIHKAIEAMKIHHQWLPDKIIYEKDQLSPDTARQLEQMGHKLQPTDNLGRLMGILYDRDLDIYIGASDASSPDGAASGY